MVQLRLRVQRRQTQALATMRCPASPSRGHRQGLSLQFQATRFGMQMEWVEQEDQAPAGVILQNSKGVDSGQVYKRQTQRVSSEFRCLCAHSGLISNAYQTAPVPCPWPWQDGAQLQGPLCLWDSTEAPALLGGGPRRGKDMERFSKTCVIHSISHIRELCSFRQTSMRSLVFCEKHTGLAHWSFTQGRWSMVQAIVQEAQVIWRLDHNNQSILAQSAGLDFGDETLM